MEGEERRCRNKSKLALHVGMGGKETCTHTVYNTEEEKEEEQ